MNTQAAKDFAKWLATDQPELFVALYKKAIPATAKASLGDFTDILSSIGSGLSSAINNVGSFLSSSQGLQSLTSLSSAYLNTQAAKTAVQLQTSRAQQGLAPAPIQTVYNPNTQQYEPLLIQPSGQAIPLTPTVAQSIGGAGLPPWLPWALGGGLLLAMVLLIRR